MKLQTIALFSGLCPLLLLCEANVAQLAAQEWSEPPELSAEQAAAINFAYSVGKFDYRASDHQRTGLAQSVRGNAIPSNTRHYGGYYVGGGVPYFGTGRRLDEGTFGWDYAGLFLPARVALNWSHGGRHQGGGGTYQTSGPKLPHR